MSRDRCVAVIGAGQTAARSVSAMRDAGFDGTIVLIGDETELPYERPPLSKDALFAEAEPAPATIFDERFYQDHGVELRLGARALSIDAASGDVTLQDGERIKADRILIASGARARAARIDGIDPQRILSLRTLADAKRLRAGLSKPCRVALIGGGFIGLEIAAGAARLGCAVTVIEARPRLIERAVSTHVSAWLDALHRSHGVTVKTACTIAAARQGDTEIELTLSDGTKCVADLIVAGVGAVPNAELAQAAGIACNNGIEVNAQCHTSAGIVWAAGDVAARVHGWWGTRVRLESWENAELQAACAGRAIAASWSDEAPAIDVVDAPPWFWTDQYDVNVQILGCVSGSDRIVTREGTAGTLLFHFQRERLRGAELLGAARERPLIRKLLQLGWPLAADRLADTSMSLKECVAAAQAA
ncbi:MAG TPA: FAD-dependent oxidoreductase [Paraburkholderia sp.]|jgi:3-phenylpropionate/trans-cinnamate dioxygenase ferredoxin reductase subunit